MKSKKKIIRRRKHSRKYRGGTNESGCSIEKIVEKEDPENLDEYQNDETIKKASIDCVTAYKQYRNMTQTEQSGGLPRSEKYYPPHLLMIPTFLNYTNDLKDLNKRETKSVDDTMSPEYRLKREYNSKKLLLQNLITKKKMALKKKQFLSDSDEFAKDIQEKTSGFAKRVNNSDALKKAKKVGDASAKAVSKGATALQKEVNKKLK